MENSINIPLTILEFVLALGFLAFLHEFGHFLVARLLKIEIEEFGFGFPPRMLRLFKLGGTDFSLNWIPFGAFVRPKGENNPEIPGGLAAANPWARLAVLLGGPVVNLLTGIILFTMVFTQTGAPDSTTVMIIDVNEGSPAALSGLLPNDIVRKINGQDIDSTETLSNIIKKNLGKEVTITYERQNQLIEIQAVPRLNPPEGQGALGITMGNPTIPLKWYQAVPLSVMVTYDQGRQLFILPIRLLMNDIPAEQARVVGPKGMYDIFQQARTMDIETTSNLQTETSGLNTFIFLAILSIALGFTNLLPIPALDGGRIIFVLPEFFLHKRVPAQFENVIHLIGITAMIGLMFYITAQDIINPIVLP